MARAPTTPDPERRERATTIPSRFRQFIREERGEDLIEYALLAAFVAAVATAAIITDPLGIKPALINAFNRAKTALDNA